MKQYSLKTLPTELASKQFCLDFLMTVLDVLPSQTLIRELAYIAKTLDQAGSMIERHDELVEKYASFAMKEDLIKDSAREDVFLLFNRFALKIIDELLRIKVHQPSIFLPSVCHSNGDSYIELGEVSVPVSAIGKRLLSIEGLFLLANTLVNIIENESPCPEVEASEQARIFYSRIKIDQSVAIGRSRMYRYGEFPLRLEKIGIDVEEYLQAVFSLCAHVESQPLMELELPGSLRQMNVSAKQILPKYLLHLSSDIKSEVYDLTAASALSKLYYTDYLCRQHPLIQVDGRYYCLEPGLLWAALADLPFYLLLDSCARDDKKVTDLGRAWGDIFEANWRDLGQRVFGVDKCKDYTCQKTHPNLMKEHRIGDLFVTLETNTRVILEFKGAAPDDPIKSGNRSRARSKLIEQIEKNKGIPQLVRDASVYRQETLFNGIIFIVFICRGPIPLTSDFDMDVKKYLQELSSYQDYLANFQNRPVIWLDALSAEALFSGLRQGLPIEDTLESLAGVSTSQIPKIIIEKIQQHSLKLSRSPLYAEEIELQAELCRSMFRDPCEIST